MKLTHTMPGISNKITGQFMKNIIDSTDMIFQKALKEHQSGNIQQAKSLYLDIIKKDLTYSDAYHLLGVIQAQQSQIAQAIHNIGHAIKLSECELYYNSLGAVYLKQGYIQNALFNLNKALKINDQYIDAYNNLGQTLLLAGECVDAVNCFRKVISLNSNVPQLYSNYLTCLNYLPSISHETIYQAHVSFNKRFHSNQTIAKHQFTKKPKKKLRIGYVSPDFCRGSVAFFIEPVLRNHDADAFEIFCYANTSQPDDITQRIKPHAKKWIETNQMNDDQMADKIMQDKIDILVDLCGHFSENRLPVFTRKPAPIQMTYLGYPNTTGLSSIDYRLTDAIADPHNRDVYHSEKLVRLPAPFLCYQPVVSSPDLSTLPADTNGFVTLGSFNNLAKITDNVIHVWATILRQIKYAKLLLKARPFIDPVTCAHFQNKFQQKGISQDRLIFKCYDDRIKTHLMAYNNIDLALDTFPYNGTTTTCDALWMGVPVISLCGSCHANRVGATLLSSIGMKDFIAYSENEYITKTIDICQNLQLLKTIRRQLRSVMQQSTLMDAKRLTMNIESVYKSIWSAKEN
jgi:predicted O-linked N-acetylglucosamine transferase (SPINDLY family)